MWAKPNLRIFIGTRQPLVWTLAALIGVGVAMAAIGFRLAIGLLQWPWLRDMSERVASAAQAVPWYWVLLAPAAASFDQYDSFEKRGEDFVAQVRA